MILSFTKEASGAELRAAATPETVKKLVELGATVVIESGAGQKSLITDEDYKNAGAQICSDRDAVISKTDVLLRCGVPAPGEIAKMRKGALYAGLLDPFFNPELVKEFADAGVDAVSMEMIPRSTIAQKMDVLSSQSSLGGYVAVILAAERLNKILPMMMTPSGTISPARVFVIGAGVAGLQAIATAKRLGARVDAFDTRPVVEEQVKSLGARFLKVDLGDTGQTKDGYAKALTEEQLAKQRAAMAKQCALSDIVITTAQVFGRRAPVIITKEMLEGMKQGSVVVDMAASTGGNVEGTVAGQETVTSGGVRIIGLSNLPARVAVNASQMYANNIFNLVSEFWDKESKTLKLDTENEIADSCLIVSGGAVRNERIRELIKG